MRVLRSPGATSGASEPEGVRLGFVGSVDDSDRFSEPPSAGGTGSLGPRRFSGARIGCRPTAGGEAGDEQRETRL